MLKTYLLHHPVGIAGASELLGLECAGIVVDVGQRVTNFKKGDHVMALLDGGGYASKAVCPAGYAMHIPESFDFIQAAAIPEVRQTYKLQRCH